MTKVSYIRMIDTINGGDYLGQIPVANAELTLIKDNRPTCVGLIRCIKKWESFVDPETDHNQVGDIRIGRNISEGVFEYWEPIKVLLTSLTENIESGDSYVNGQHMYQADRFYEKAINDKKILAFPEHFSPKQLQMIVEGELKDRDIVLIECTHIKQEGYKCEECGERVTLGSRCRNPKHKNVIFNDIDEHRIKINNFNHIILHNVNNEKMYPLNFVRFLTGFSIDNIDNRYKRWLQHN